MVLEQTTLIERSQRGQWQPDDLPWQLGSRLDERQRPGLTRLLSQIWFGEQLSFQIIEQLIAGLEEPAAIEFLRLQLADEARHAAVFARYLALLGPIEPPGRYLSELAEGLLALPGLEEKLIGTHILLEGIALETFHALAQTVPDPLLQQIMRRVFLDESRHVAFGTAYLRQAVARLDPSARDRVLRESGHFVVVAAGLIREEEANAASFGLDLRAVQQRTIRVVLRRLHQIGIF